MTPEVRVRNVQECRVHNDLVFFVKLVIRPECVTEWREAFTEIVTAMSREDAFISCYLHQDACDMNQFTLYEKWAEPGVDSFLQNQMKPYRLAYDTKLERLLQRLAACWKAPVWRTKLERRVALTESLRALRYGYPSSPFVDDSNAHRQRLAPIALRTLLKIWRDHVRPTTWRSSLVRAAT